MWLADDAIWITLFDTPLPTPDSSGDAGPSPLSFEERGEGPGERGEVLGVNLKISFPGADSNVRIEPINPLTTTVSYFLGHDPDQWRPAVPVYGGVHYGDLYPGVDLVVGDDLSAGLSWRLEAQPNAKTDTMRLRIEGAKDLTLANRVAHITTEAQVLALPLPAADFAMHLEGIGMDGQLLVINAPLGAGDALDLGVARSHAATDDPADLLYSTFLGGSDREHSWECSVALDSSGRAYVISNTYSSDFPTTPGVFDPSLNGSEDAFVVRLNAAGSALDYATFLGGDGEECAVQRQVWSLRLGACLGHEHDRPRCAPPLPPRPSHH